MTDNLGYYFIKFVISNERSENCSTIQHRVTLFMRVLQYFIIHTA